MAVLGNLIEQVRGVSYKPEDLHTTLNENSVVLLRANNIKDGQLNFENVIYVDRKKVSEKQFLKAGDILICASSGSKELVGKAAYVDGDLLMTFGAFCKVVRPRTSCPQYIGHFFNSPYYRERIVNSAAGANINNIRNEHIDVLEIVWPSIEEQRSAVTVLDKVSELIALRKEQLAKLDLLVQSKFVDLFEDSFKKSRKMIIDIAEEVTVGIANSATHAYADTGVVMLRNQNIRVNYLDDRDLIYITPDFANNYKNKALKANDILVTRTGVNVGMACLVPEKYSGCQTFTTLILRLKSDAGILPAFVCYYINSPLGKAFIDNHKVGGAQPNFGAKQLAVMPIAVPPMVLQEQFAAFVEQTDKSKLAIQQSLNKLVLLKKALMQEYFG